MIHRERVSLTLDKNIINSVDATIDGNKVRNRSHAVELLLAKALGEKRVKKAFILAGGKGTRLRPITYEIPKPMVPIQGRPLLEHTIEVLKKYEIRDIIISIGFLGDKIREHFGNGSKFGVKITYVEEKEARGTSGPLLMAKPLLENNHFVMINGDNLFNLDLYDMIRAHFENDAIATIALASVSDPTRYGVAKLKGSKILEFIEKPKIEQAPSNLINAGVYLFSPKIFDYVPDKIFSMIETEVFPKLIADKQFYGYVMGGQWLPAGTPDEYEAAIKEWRGVD
ncbi:MAG: nucleotidyltransferase family protein [Nanoarchaeota archaeon]|nr:nucleotidyltransferase family protein [Nanoarchaeota archaeon]